MTECEACKYCTNLKGCYCFCKKRNNRVNILDRTDCKYFVKKEDSNG